VQRKVGTRMEARVMEDRMVVQEVDQEAMEATRLVVATTGMIGILEERRTKRRRRSRLGRKRRKRSRRRLTRRLPLPHWLILVLAMLMEVMMIGASQLARRRRKRARYVLPHTMENTYLIWELGRS
jgi:type VI protein secretion system component VasF